MGRNLPIEEVQITVVGSETDGGSCCCNEHEHQHERFKMLREAKDLRSNRPAKIQKVIFLLQDYKHFTKYFKPRVASLGPIHHGTPMYHLGEKYKLRLANEFIQGFSGEDFSDDDIKRLYQKIKQEIVELRECFEEEVTKNYDDDDLTWVLLVDGCAILQYIYCASRNKFTELKIKNDSVAFAQQDLFLLENQVPYRLLKLLMKLSGKEEMLKDSINTFIRNEAYQQKQVKSKGEFTREPTHLLDLLRTTLLGPSSDSQPKTKAAWYSQILARLWEKHVCGKKSSQAGQDEDQDWQSFRNVQELRAAGIQVKRAENNYLRNISFDKLCGFYPGRLWLPQIRVDDSSGPKFMNLIAYEMCLDFENDFGITSYISFLDSLIDEVSDVKELRKARILHNCLGSDQEVADLFNEIGTDLVPNFDIYMEVKRKIQEHYQNNLMTWMAQFFHDHFSSPWTIIAFSGALLGLGLSASQTWYAVNTSSSPCDALCTKLGANSA